MRFVDTNVLLYAVSREPNEAPKADVARRLLKDRDLALSTQVLQEFYVQATRTSRRDALSHEQAVGFVTAFARFTVSDITLDLVQAAMAARQRFGVSYWDAAIIESARTLGCVEVLSEDLSDTQDYGGVRVRNPFR